MPAIWTTPITNRTAADLDDKTKKATIEAADLNRIEGNTAFLADMLDFEAMAASTGWTPGDLVFEADIRRILDGALAARTASLKAHPPALPGWMPAVPARFSSLEDANDVEAIQLRARRAAEGNRVDFAHTGEPVLGGKTGVL